MEERREMNGQRVMTRDELEMRLPALNHIAEQRDAKFRLRYAEKTVNNGIERGYTLDAGTRVSVNVYQNESWVQMPDEELFDTLNDLDGRYCVTEDQETIGERLNALFKSGELFEKIYPVVVSENNKENFAEAGITFDRYLDLLVTYVIEGESETDGYAAAIVTYDNLDTFDLPRGKLFEYASRNLKSDIRIGFTGTTGQLAMLEIGRLSGGVGGASALLLSSVWESAVKLLGTEKIIFFALSNCELMAVVAEERIIHALKSGLFDAARESVPVEEYFPKSIYGLVSDRSGYCLHRF